MLKIIVSAALASPLVLWLFITHRSIWVKEREYGAKLSRSLLQSYQCLALPLLFSANSVFSWNCEVLSFYLFILRSSRCSLSAHCNMGFSACCTNSCQGISDKTRQRRMQSIIFCLYWSVFKRCKYRDTPSLAPTASAVSVCIDQPVWA